MYAVTGAYSNIKWLGYFMSASLDLVGASRFILILFPMIAFYISITLAIKINLDLFQQFYVEAATCRWSS
jgi:hypothetical protein